MKRSFILLLFVLVVMTITGCAYLQTKDEPPPLPPIEETKPPLTMKKGYFDHFPWDGLAKARKDGNDPDTTLYTMKDGDTLESVATNTMGDPALAGGLERYNELSSPTGVKSGDKLVIPYPIIGMSSTIMIKAKGEPDFGNAKTFPVELKKGDQYQLKFEPNASGYAYVFRKGAKGVTLLYPAPAKKGKGKKKDLKPLLRDTSKVTAHTPIIIPLGKTGFVADPKKAGDMLYVFLSLRKIEPLESLVEKTTIGPADLDGVMRSVKEGGVFNEPPVHLIRAVEPNEILGFTLNLDG
jgi:hypothetical protein